jgi:hypothetical protein
VDTLDKTAHQILLNEMKSPCDVIAALFVPYKSSFSKCILLDKDFPYCLLFRRTMLQEIYCLNYLL